MDINYLDKTLILRLYDKLKILIQIIKKQNLIKKRILTIINFLILIKIITQILVIYINLLNKDRDRYHKNYNFFSEITRIINKLFLIDALKIIPFLNNNNKSVKIKKKIKLRYIKDYYEKGYI